MFWAPVPLAKANQTPGGSRGEGAAGGLIVFPFTSQTSGPGVDIRRSQQPHTLEGQCPRKVTAPIGRGMHVNPGGSKQHAKQTGGMGIFDCQALFLPLPSSSATMRKITVTTHYPNVKLTVWKTSTYSPDAPGGASASARPPSVPVASRSFSRRRGGESGL